MKKLFGVMILAGLPVGCGTTLPSTPETAATSGVTTGTDASLVGSQASSILPCSVTDVPREIAKIELVRFNRTSPVQLRAIAYSARSEPINSCFVPTWSVVGGTRDDARVEVGRDARVASLVASKGDYTVVATVNKDGASIPRISASLVVSVG